MSSTLSISFDYLLKEYESSLSSFDFPEKPEGLYNPVRHIMQMKGKRIRPLLLLLSNEAFGGKFNDAVGPAYAIEVFHNFTLVHDDIMDNAPLRRGFPTVHKEFGKSQAILSGDVMLSYAYRFLSQAPKEKLSLLLNAFTKTAIEVMEGQQMDMDFEQRMDITESEYLSMIQLKTSVLLANALEMGALIANANDEDHKKMYEFGLLLGLSFQIKDDYLDAFGDKKLVGKKTGGDIVNNKKTYLLVSALNNTTLEERSKLISLLDEKNEDQKINGVLDFYKQHQIPDLTINKSKELFEKALIALDQTSLSKEKKLPLVEMAHTIYDRTY